MKLAAIIDDTDIDIGIIVSKNGFTRDFGPNDSENEVN